MKTSNPRLLFAVFLLSVISDQLTKFVAVETIQPFQIIQVIPHVFNLTLTYNRGIAFGLFSGLPDGVRELILGAATLIALSVILFFLYRYYYQSRLGQLGVALIVGGALGNIIDRVRLGHVVDFLDFYFKQYHWPTFNIADSCVCIGVGILLFIPSAKPAEEGLPGDVAPSEVSNSSK